MPNITGSLKDAIALTDAAGGTARGRVLIKPYGTDVQVQGDDAILGTLPYDIDDMPSPLTLDAGSYTVSITSTAYLSGTRRPEFQTRSVDFELTADTSWGTILAGEAETPPLTPSLVVQAQEAAAEAEMWASTAEGVQDTQVSTLVTTEGTATAQALSATFAAVRTPQAFGAVVDGVTDDTAAVQAAIDAASTDGGVVYFAPGTYRVSGVTSAAHGVTLRGAGKNRSIIESATGDVLTLSHEYVTLEGLCVRSQAGGGHVVVVAPSVALAQSRFVDCQFRQFNDGKSVWYFSDTTGLGGGMFDCHWIDCLFRHTTTATVPGFDVYSNSNNCFSANRFTRCRAHSSGTYFFDVRLDAPGTFNYNNVWDSINFEICDGGGVRMWGANNTGIHNPGFFDNGTIVGDLIRFARNGTNNQSRGNRVTNYHRSGGTLSGGAVDIHLVSGQNAGTTLIEGVSGTSTAGVKVDLGSSSGYVVLIGYDPVFVTVANANPARTVLLTSDSGMSLPALTVAGVQYLTGTADPEGSVTAASGALYVKTAGSGNTSSARLYVKETGAGNTGWRPANAAPTRTTAQLASATDSVNTTGKAAGRMVFNTTTGRPVWATGSTATSTWVDATGTVAHTPA